MSFQDLPAASGLGAQAHLPMTLRGSADWTAEPFELVDAADLATGRSPLFDSGDQRPAASGPASDGGLDLPLVSVLVRSMGLPLLQQALDSVARQTYDGIEVVVVNASGQPHPPLAARCGRFPLRLVEPGQPLARAAAANRAVAEARGDWLIFLDDDDLFDAGHVARLRGALAAQPRARAAYAGVRLQHADGSPAGVLDEPFDPTRLWFANYLPIHAVMFDRSLVAGGPPFDERLSVYEDWDFWLRLAREQPFLHVGGVSATYRLLGQSGLTHERDEALSRNARRDFYRKWLPVLDADTLDRLATAGELARGKARDAVAAGEAAIAGRARDVAALEVRLAEGQAAETALARQLTEQSTEHARQAAAQAEQAARQAAEAASAHAEAVAHEQARTQAVEQARAAEAAAREKNAADLQAALLAYGQLEAGYRRVTSSLSWRVTAPLRAVRSLAGPHRAGSLLQALARRLPLSAATKQHGKVWLASRPWGARVLRTLVPQAVPAQGPTPPASRLDKEAVRAEAEAELTRMLASPERIALRRGSGKPQVSVVVVLYNQAGLSLLCLRSLAASLDVDFETLVVDNASSDRMPALLERLDGARVLRQDENLGFLRAVNLAAQHAQGDHLLLLNNDAMVFPETLARAVARLQSAPDIGAVGGPILLWGGLLQEAGSVFWQDGSCAGYGRGDLPERPEYRFVRDVDYCSGAFLLVRRPIFEALGRFDMAYAPAYYEESDFCARLWEAGLRVVYDPQVRIRHFEFASETASGWAIELQQRHRQLFVERHGPLLAQHHMPSPAALLQARQRLRPGALRVLVIDDRVPLPWLGQGYPRAASVVAALAAGGDFVTHYPLQFPHESLADVARALPETVEVMLEKGLPALADFLAERQGYYDVVIVSRPHNMDVLRSILKQRGPLLHGARIVYDAEALFSLRDIAKAALAGPGLSAAEQGQRVAAEMALAQGADCIVAVSEVEAGHYRAAGYRDVQVLGHTLAPDPSPRPFDARHGFLFVGALPADDTPNADSLRWFVGEVWPHIVARLGDAAQLRIVGACQAPSILALAGPGVQVLGQAHDLAEVLDAARVFVVPTRYAAGVPHKAHEAAARGLPMVATPLIADQLGWGQFVPVGVDATSFADECLRLHGDQGHWAAVRARLLVAVTQDCAPEAFDQALQAVLGRATVETITEAPTSIAAVESIEPVESVEPAQATEPLAEAAEDAQRTAEVWGRDARQRQHAEHTLRHWASHPVTAAEINRQVSGDPQVGWMEHLKRRHFVVPGRRGLSLGCGGGAAVVDAALLDIVDVMEGLDISHGAVAVAQERASAHGVAHRVRFAVADLNRPALRGPYDLVMFEQSLHHIDALDAVLDECRRVLAPGGLFVINEYVGADRFQWSDEAERLMNELLRLVPPGHRVDPDSGAIKQAMQRTTVEQVIAIDPSEAIHSSSILAACAARFELVERKDFGGTLLQFMLAGISANFDPEDERDAALLRLMALLEAELVRAGTLASDFVFAVYRQRGG